MQRYDFLHHQGASALSSVAPRSAPATPTHQHAVAFRYPHTARSSLHKRQHVITSAVQSSKSAAGLAEQLLGLVEGSDCGVKSTADQRAAILQAVDELQQLQGGSPTTGPDVDGTWKLLWSTEKETQFIIKNAGLFGTTTGDVWQVIDTKTCRLQNVIDFPPSGAFIVDSSIDPEPESQRINFRFDAASLTVNLKKFRVPPFGKGWFDTVYLDPATKTGTRLRVAKDIRGDTLVAQWGGPPKQFT